MKAVLCDICERPIKREGLDERYSFWMKDSTYYTKWPKRLDICRECKETMKDIIVRRIHQKEVEKLVKEGTK